MPSHPSSGTSKLLSGDIIMLPMPVELLNGPRSLFYFYFVTHTILQNILYPGNTAPRFYYRDLTIQDANKIVIF